MAVFSNLEGTMKKSFILGKGGARLSFDSGVFYVRNYQGTSLIPISAADPLDGTHLVTLSYFNSHAGGGSSNTLRGVTIPDISLGIDGDVYYRIDDTSILQIYIKDMGIWKPFLSQTDSEYVSTVVVTPTDFIQSGTDYVYVLSENIHGRGSNIIVQLQESSTGQIQNASIVVDSIGNITLTVGNIPTSNYNIVIIGETTLSTPYNQLINKSNWILSGSEYNLSIPQSIHEQSSGAIFISVYQNTIDSATSSSPYEIVAVETTIDVNGNITLSSNESFSGKVVISGK